MAFSQKDAEQLLAATGRRCCICGRLHGVQLHHIVPKEEGGTDDIDNGMPLCPNCHDEVHVHRVRGHGVSVRVPRRVTRDGQVVGESGAKCSKCGDLVREDGFVGEGIAYCHNCHAELHEPYATGQLTRRYTERELRLHREKAIQLTRKQGEWKTGTEAWEKDKGLIVFYAQCLDRAAFRTHFHQEMSFSAFDRAMEDTLLALNTGYWRTRDGAVIDRAKGKSAVVNPEWRDKLDEIAGLIEEIRQKFQEAVGFNEMLYRMRYGGHLSAMREMEMMMEGHLRHDRGLGGWMDEKRNEAIEILNAMLTEIGQLPLRTLDKW